MKMASNKLVLIHTIDLLLLTLFTNFLTILIPDLVSTFVVLNFRLTGLEYKQESNWPHLWNIEIEIKRVTQMQ